MNKQFKNISKVIFPLLLGAAILFWIYRDFDFSKVMAMLMHEMKWSWMIVSLVFGVLAQVVRGLRWKQVLEPLNYTPSRTNCIAAIFISYAASLVIPRIGEVTRCGILKERERIPFAESLGTVVTERVIDTLSILIIAFLTFILNMDLLISFFKERGVKSTSVGNVFSSSSFYLYAFILIGLFAVLYYLLANSAFYTKIKNVMQNFWLGVLSLRKVKNIPLFILYTLLIWGFYYLHFYLTFYCFSFMADLNPMVGLVLFVVGTFAVVIPTPNGAGPWHFAIISFLVFYGVCEKNSEIYALIVHGIQTFLILLLGIIGMLLRIKKRIL